MPGFDALILVLVEEDLLAPGGHRSDLVCVREQLLRIGWRLVASSLRNLGVKQLTVLRPEENPLQLFELHFEFAVLCFYFIETLLVAKAARDDMI